MDCRVIEAKQDGDDTDQWDALRRGRITGSRVADVMSRPVWAKGPDPDKPGKQIRLLNEEGNEYRVESDRHKKYRMELTLELLGHIGVEESPEWFRHGREMEPRGLYRSVEKYSWELDRDVFLIHKDYDWMGVSPDSLIVAGGEYIGGIEMKARKLYKNYTEAIQRAKKYADTDRAKMIDPGYRYQVQSAMWVTGLDHWWYVNYYEVKNQHGHSTGDYKLGRCAIPRDQNLIDQIEEACLNFMHVCYENACLETEK